MKATHTTLKLIFSLALFIVLISCEDEDIRVKPETPVSPGPALAQFAQQTLTIAENDGLKEISIVLDKAATKDGIVTINLTAENMNSFITTPALVDGKIQLQVLSGQSSAKFSFTPVDNNVLNGNQSVDFTITAVSEGFTIGTKKILSVTLADNESPAQVSFLAELGSTLENTAIASTVAIGFSHSSPGTGSIEITLASDKAAYGIHYTTEPEATNGKIVLPVEMGIDKVEFNVIPMNDQLFNGDRDITYTITATEGSVDKGQTLTHVLKIKDDELSGMAKGYTIGAGSWGYKREYQYNEQGKLSKILWERNTPGHLAGTYTYEYDASGNLVRMIENDFTETLYTWENGRLVKEESVKDGIVKKYTLYGYDHAGNVGEAAVHYRQPGGELKLGLVFVYLYYLDGNLFKQLTYNPVEGEEEYTLISTRTYENYLSNANPFPIELLPNVNSQPNLPGSYRVEENGHDILYTFFYEFDDNGKPVERTASSSSGSETVYYEYY
jgi:YD repeat-containing protein